jgi:hypothetical protein
LYWEAVVTTQFVVVITGYTNVFVDLVINAVRNVLGFADSIVVSVKSLVAKAAFIHVWLIRRTIVNGLLRAKAVVEVISDVTNHTYADSNLEAIGNLSNLYT